MLCYVLYNATTTNYSQKIPLIGCVYLAAIAGCEAEDLNCIGYLPWRIPWEIGCNLTDEL